MFCFYRYMLLSDNQDIARHPATKPVRERREVNMSDIIEFARSSPLYQALLDNVTDSLSVYNITSVPVDLGPEEPYVAAIVYGKLEIEITNLKHFQDYSIEVYLFRIIRTIRS